MPREQVVELDEANKNTEEGQEEVEEMEDRGEAVAEVTGAGKVASLLGDWITLSRSLMSRLTRKMN